jgi:hypothetical protein
VMQPRWCGLRGNSIKKGFILRASFNARFGDSRGMHIQIRPGLRARRPQLILSPGIGQIIEP